MKTKYKKDNFSNLATEDLIKKKKSTSFVTGLLTGALVGLFIVTMSQTINRGFTPFLIIPIAFLPLLIVMYGQVRSITKELESRKQNN